VNLVFGGEASVIFGGRIGLKSGEICWREEEEREGKV
jgi:hypothetical protein